MLRDGSCFTCAELLTWVTTFFFFAIRWTASISHVAALRTAVETSRGALSLTPSTFRLITSTPSWDWNWSGVCKKRNRAQRTRLVLQRSFKSMKRRRRSVQSRMHRTRAVPLASPQRRLAFLSPCPPALHSISSQSAWQWRRTAAAVIWPNPLVPPRTVMREDAAVGVTIFLRSMEGWAAPLVSVTLKMITIPLTAKRDIKETQWNSRAAAALLTPRDHTQSTHSQTI